MQNQTIAPFRIITQSLNKIHEKYEHLFDVPEDRNQTIADFQMPLTQIEDSIDFGIVHHTPVSIQLNVKQSVYEVSGYLHLTLNGGVRLVNPDSGLTHVINTSNIRSITNLV